MICGLLLGFALALTACATSSSETAPTNGPQVPAPPPEGDGGWIEGVIVKDRSGGYSITDAQGTARAVEDAPRASRLADNVGRRARASVWWSGKGEQRARIGTVTSLQVMDGPEIDAARAAIERFGCPDVGLRTTDPLWLEDRHSPREMRFKVLAERADKTLLLIWLARDPRDASRLNVASASASEGKMLAPLCAAPP